MPRSAWSTSASKAMRAGVLALCVGALLIAAPTALAQGPGNPFSPGVPQPTPTVQTQPQAPIIATPTTSSSGDNGLSSGGVLAIAIGALLVLGGISFFIWRDARRRAPVRHRAATATAGADPRAGSKQRSKPRKLSPAERRRRKRGRAR